MLTSQYLVEKTHVDVNARSAYASADDRHDGDGPSPGRTALYLLASADHYWQLGAIKYLIAHGADINALDAQKMSPIHIAAAGKQHDGQDIEHLWSSEALSILLDQGADLNIVDEIGHSPLHKAANSIDTTKELLQRGVDATAGRPSPVFQAIYHQIWRFSRHCSIMASV